MRILITGGAGCLGSNLIEHWLPQGHEILVLDNFATGKREVVPPVPGLSLIEGTVADRDLVNDAFHSFAPTHVVHGAAAYKDPADWREDAASNVVGTIHVVEAARAHGVARLVNFQTVLCYGRPRSVPIPVDHPLQPFTSYAISKVAGEQYLAMSGLPFASLRLANVTGPRLAIGPLPTFYKRLKAGQGCFCTDAQRDFLDMSDFLAAVDLVMANGASSGIFNVSSGEGRSIRDVYDAVRAHLGLSPDPDVKVVPVGDDDVPAVVPDPSRTTAVLGWRAKVSFSETIGRMLAWYDAHGVSDVYSHLAAAR
jgi:nucleoside-diphosphate-sugar epimerase